MRKFLLCIMAVLMAPVSQAFASNVGFSIGINVGTPGVVAPVYAPPQPVVIEEEPPEFIQPPQMGFYVAAGVPYDLFFVGNLFYLCSGNVWYTSPYYNGPWTRTYYNHIPYVIRRHPVERVHYYRDNYFRRSSHNGDWRGYQHFQPIYRETNRDSHGGSRPAYNTPGRPHQGNGNRPVYNTPTRPDHGNWNKPNYNAPIRQQPGNWGRSVNNTPSGANQGNGNRPVYNASTRRDQGNSYSYASNAPNRQASGNSGRSEATTPRRPDHGNVNTPVNYNQNRQGQGNSGTEGRGRQ